MRKKVRAVNIERKPAREVAADAEPETRYHHGNLRAALVEAGLAQLEKSERAELSLRELARQVGVSPNAAYRHFADKEALLVALAGEGFRKFGNALAKAPAARAGGIEAFRASGRAYVNFARANPALFRLMFGRFASSHRSAELMEPATAAFDGLRGGVARVMGAGADEARVTLAAIRSWSLVHGLSHLLLDGQIDQFSDDTDALIDAVLHQALQSESDKKPQSRRR